MSLRTLSANGKIDSVFDSRVAACSRGSALMAFVLLCASGVARADDAPASPPVELSVPMLVAGILKFTQFPPPPHAVRLCVVGDGRSARELLAAPLGGVKSETLSVTGQAGAVVRAQCDALYVDQQGQSSHALLSDLVERPVLTIGEGSTFCSDGGMFCVDSQQKPLKFGTNLDAISRSGLRVNPQVLFLARRKGGGGS